MGIIPATMSDRQVEQMSDEDFTRLVVEPGERLCADIIAMCAEAKARNQQFLDERHGGITIEQARELWTSDADRNAVQAEYRLWYAARF